MRAERLLRLQLLLQARGRITADALACELGVSVRTIYRDVGVLSGSGVPVYAEVGPGGGFRLLEGYRSPLGRLTPADAEALLAIGVPAALAEVGLADGLNRIQLKLAAQVSDPRAETTPPLFLLDAPRWFHAADPPPNLAVLATAVRGGRAVRIAPAGRPRRVMPLGLVNKAGTWYFVSLSTRRPRVNRVDRLESVELLDDTIVRPRDFDLAAFWSEWSREFERTLPEIEVRVRCEPGLATALPTILGETAHHALRDAVTEEDGRLVFVLRFESPRAAAHHLASLAPALEVLHPETVCAELRDLGARLLATYVRPASAAVPTR